MSGMVNRRPGQATRSTVGEILAPTDGVRGARAKQGLAVRDHSRENRVALKEMQRQNRSAAAVASADEAMRAPENQFKLAQFRDVESRLTENKRGDAQRARDEDEAARRREQERRLNGARDCNAAAGITPGYGSAPGAVVSETTDARGQQFLRRRTGEERQNEVSQAAQERRRKAAAQGGGGGGGGGGGASSPGGDDGERPLSARSSGGDERGATPRKSGVPRANEVAKLAPRRETDFVGRNRVDMRDARPPPQRDAGAGAGDEPRLGKEKAQVGSVKYVPPPRGKHSEQGKVPEYLKARQQGWKAEAEARARAQPDPDCPPGMVRMPEGERAEMLASLKSKDAELRAELFKLPLATKTLAQQKRKTALEQQLDEVERNIAVFSKPKVFVADD